MGAARRLLPFETLDSAAEILNQICHEKQIQSRHSFRDFLAWAINGELNLTVVLPDTFYIKKKNHQTLSKNKDLPLPLQSFPKGATHFFADKHAIFQLSLGQSAPLKSVFVISDDGVKTTYQSMEPYISISIPDLLVSDEQLFQRMTRIHSSKATSETDVQAKEDSDATADQPKEKNEWDKYKRKRLLDEYNAGDTTHADLGLKYGVSRQRIGLLIRLAREEWGTKKASAFSSLQWKPKK